MHFQIVPITEEHVKDFWSAVDSVARERKYLAFLEGPPINTTKDFVLQNIHGNWPHFVAILKKPNRDHSLPLKKFVSWALFLRALP